MNKKIAININFDSFSEAFGYPKNFRDETYFKFLDEFILKLELSDVKISFFIIGRDLLNPEIKSRVKHLSQMGNEIGNHSYNHRMDLGSLNKNQIEYEVLKSHEIILNTTHKEPNGFVAPAWSTSKVLWDVLCENNYTYDSSLFPSIWLYPMIAKIFFNHLGNKKRLMEIISRKDYLYPFFFSSRPFVYKKSLKIMPLPNYRKIMVPFWHTLFFIFGSKFTKAYLKFILKRYNNFYYLLHPLDFSSFNNNYYYNNGLERAQYPIDKKIKYLKESFDYLKENGFEIITMKELSNQI